MTKPRKTMVGKVDPEILEFTAGGDIETDLVLVEPDCIGTAAHVTMLSRMPCKPRPVSAGERDSVVAALIDIIRSARRGRFSIRTADQDVHLAIERILTRELGAVGKKVHTARSRNDQIALDLRLYGREQLLCVLEELAACSRALLKFARRHAGWPMVGRTHMRPAMPSSVGLWASAHAESLLEDAVVLRAAFELTDRSPLGSAAGYGVPLPVDRNLTARLLGFRKILHNVLYASMARGKCEAATLSALSQTMLSLSRLSRDLIVYSAPEFGYFRLPEEYCTGSSIMPQKSNPDVMELVRARATRVSAHASAVTAITSALTGGYSRDLQETKQPFIEGISTTRSCLRVTTRLVGRLKADRKNLEDAFAPDVYAADRALELVQEGLSFREAYNYVKTHLDELRKTDPREAVSRKRHTGAPAGLDFEAYEESVRDVEVFVRRERRRCNRAISGLLGIPYPELAE